MSGLSFSDVERIRAVLVCIRPTDLFPASSYKGAIFQLGGTTEVAEGILSVYAGHLARPLGRLPAADPKTWWDLGRPVYLAQGPTEAQAASILAAEVQCQEADKSLVRTLASDALARIFTLRPGAPQVFFDGASVVPIPLSPSGEVQKRRIYEHRTAQNLRKALAYLG